ncbi:FHA domain-containing protein [Granulicoccus sp. GXG6511]|uniref:FHA domain-containing protein n=1 Tax=Granulicoccus sp. GXG6511 TaxID=3381351 RepID=UPI003D7EAE8A
MTEQIGLWRATYTPGDWVVLGGPTSLVVLQPAPAHSSGLIERLWQVVLEADSLDALIAELARHNVSKMADFAAFFWHGDAMRSLIRGELQIVDVASGDVIANGADVQTWSEVGLGDVRRVRVDLGSEEGTQGPTLRLPLVVGAVTAGSLEIDATDAALVSSPQGAAAQPEAVVPVPMPAPTQEPLAELEPARSAVVDAVVVEDEAVPAVTETSDEDPQSGHDVDEPAPSARRARPAPDPFGSSPTEHPFGESEPAPADAQDDGLEPGGSTEAFNPFGTSAAQPAAQSADPHNPFALSVVQDHEDPPASPVSPQPPDANPFGAPAGAANPFAPPPAAYAQTPPIPQTPPQAPPPIPSTQAPLQPPPLPQSGPPAEAVPSPSVSSAAQTQNGMVLGVTCEQGHANPPEAQRCRRCGGGLQGQPRLMPRPVMAVLRASDGQEIDVDRSVLIGRSPQASKVSRDELPKLLTVVSPSTDISRTHLQVSPDGWEVVATDLHSTNGTLLIRPGQPEPERMAPGEPLRIFPGCVLDLGDGVSIHVEHPA